jgi:hypothetical protein
VWLRRNVLKVGVVSELSETYPPIQPAIKHIPEWHSKMPREVNHEDGNWTRTVKTCMPFFDAMALGFIIPCPVDLRLSVSENGTNISYRYHGYPDPQGTGSSSSAVTGHDNSQTLGYHDGAVIKIASPYFIETAPGYSALITAPFNKLKGLLPFSGLVSTDKYKNPVNIPCRWVGPDGEFFVRFGEPLAQVVVVKNNARITNGVVSKSLRALALRQQNAVSSRRDAYKTKYR